MAVVINAPAYEIDGARRAYRPQADSPRSEDETLSGCALCGVRLTKLLSEGNR